MSNLPNYKVLRLFPSQVDLVFSSSINNLKKITSKDFKVGFNYDSIEKEKKTAKFMLLKAPLNANNIKFNPKNVFFLIRE